MKHRLKIFVVVGARPNFMKIAPLLKVMRTMNDKIYPIIVHTGQHYDFNMSDSFFIDLNIPKPDYFLGVGSGTHAEQTARIMIEFEKILLIEQPEILIVVGDVNSTLACTVVASKTRYSNNEVKFQSGFVIQNKRPVIVHVEAGLRSFDRTMPEEINRIITDSISDVLFTSEDDANSNLVKEGINTSKVHYVGNVMIDALEMVKSKIDQCPIVDEVGLAKEDYGVITLHRPSNVDNPTCLRNIVDSLLEISKKVKLAFPVHPRTRKRLENDSLIHLLERSDNIKLLDPLSYKEFMKLLFMSKFTITDSGGLQEETTYLGIPCITLRPNTERPVTVTQGTNELATVNSMNDKIISILKGNWKKGTVPEFWDGKTAERIVSTLLNQVEVM